MLSSILLSSLPFIPCLYSTLHPYDQQNISPIYYQECINWYNAVSDVDFLDITYKSDNLDVKGIIAQPKAIHTKLPVIIFCRGGSNDAGKVTVCTLKNKIYSWVKRGYIVMAPQYRGTETIEGADEFGGDDIHDVLNSIEIVKNLPYADANNIFMIGHSRGAMMTLMTIQHTLSIKAIALIGALTDLFEYEKQWPELIIFFNKLIPGMPENKHDAYTKRSATYWADNINIPTLIMHGDTDPIVDVNQSHMLSNALKKHNKPHRIIIFPQGSHSLLEYQNQVDEEIMTWFQNN